MGPAVEVSAPVKERAQDLGKILAGRVTGWGQELGRGKGRGSWCRPASGQHGHSSPSPRVVVPALSPTGTGLIPHRAALLRNNSL